MRTTAFLIMTSSLLVLIAVTHRAVTISVSLPPGLLNPTVHFVLHPDARDIFFATLLAGAVSTYCFAMIAWIEQRLDELHASLSDVRSDRELPQPVEMRRLKDAIRSGNLPAVRRYAKESVLEAADERYLTPLELAVLYGQQAVVDALRTAMLQHARRKAAPGQRIVLPASQFALRRS